MGKEPKTQLTYLALILRIVICTPIRRSYGDFMMTMP